MNDLLQKIAFSFLSGFRAEHLEAMDMAGISRDDFFEADMQSLSQNLGLECRFELNDRQQAMFRAREELDFVQRNNIRAIFIEDEEYPALLRETPDAPVLLYVLGKADLNAPNAFSVVGTRRCTAYGAGFCKQFVTDMCAYFPAAPVVSGLAFGIDAAAHTAALECGMPTFGVLAHGLNMIYPAAHRNLAKTIIKAGGALISEYPNGVRPFQRNFLERNRIVAGLTELTVVVESEVRGGAMSTARQAFSYSREVVALPGRSTDISSSGCNSLIARNQAHIFTTVADVLRLTGWTIPSIGISMAGQTQNLFPELEGDSATVYEYLRKKASPASIDEMHSATRLAMPTLMSILTELEFDGIVVKLPGSRFEPA